ncbi:MAG TPA: hypothetical protein VLH10_04925 [Yinghuangia sp.]|uniref:hypothetical protein n=1 Tax=Yinghuangia sp. YIM S10712 TaxID=3436930 RepID=UPI002B760085|nr:hypothetical protein [Yinghuangia sp.]
MSGDDEVRDGLAALDGYLYWQGRLAAAHHHAQAIADRLPWLSAAEREDLVRVLATAHTDMARATVRHICDRADQLRAEYEERYRRLRCRLVSVTAVVLTAALTSVLLLAAGRLLTV